MLSGSNVLQPILASHLALWTSVSVEDLKNWTDELTFIKAILAGRSSGEITDEEAAEKVGVRYFEKHPGHLPTQPEAAEGSHFGGVCAPACAFAARAAPDFFFFLPFAAPVSKTVSHERSLIPEAASFR